MLPFGTHKKCRSHPSWKWTVAVLPFGAHRKRVQIAPLVEADCGCALFWDTQKKSADRTSWKWTVAVLPFGTHRKRGQIQLHPQRCGCPQLPTLSELKHKSRCSWQGLLHCAGEQKYLHPHCLHRFARTGLNDNTCLCQASIQASPGSGTHMTCAWAKMKRNSLPHAADLELQLSCCMVCAIQAALKHGPERKHVLHIMTQGAHSRPERLRVRARITVVSAEQLSHWLKTPPPKHRQNGNQATLSSTSMQSIEMKSTII